VRQANREVRQERRDVKRTVRKAKP
jgi:hypothetical protein